MRLTVKGNYCQFADVKISVVTDSIDFRLGQSSPSLSAHVDASADSLFQGAPYMKFYLALPAAGMNSCDIGTASAALELLVTCQARR